MYSEVTEEETKILCSTEPGIKGKRNEVKIHTLVIIHCKQ